MTLDYELVKQLKNAGFSYAWHDLPDHTCEPEMCFPALSELIEACGDAFWRMWRQKKRVWLVEGEDDDHNFIGKTPEEAVARLWLALKKPEPLI